MTSFPPAVRHFGDVARASRQPRRETAPPPRRLAAPETHPRREVVVRLWLPLTLIFLLLAPFAVLAIPFLYLAPPLRRMNCAVAVFVLGRMLLSLGGTVVEVETPGAVVRIRIF